LNTVVEASFPITDNVVNTEVIADNNNFAIQAPLYSDSPGWGIAALCCGILGLGFPLLGIPAIIFGAIGMKKSGKGMAIAGLILGILETLIVVLALIFVASLGSFY
jgi:hypothetical protein